MVKQTLDRSIPIVVALIGFFGTCTAAFLTVPAFQDWVGSFFSRSDSSSLALEEIPQYIFSYDGRAENLGGYAKLDLAYQKDSESPYYVLAFSVPEDEVGYAGLAFEFDKGQNVAGYRAIEFTIQFEAAEVPIDFYVEDISGQWSAIRVVSTGQDEMKLQYELGLFPEVDFNALKELGLNYDEPLANGTHFVTIHDIRFVP